MTDGGTGGKKNPLGWFKFYPRDFFNDDKVRKMTWAQRGQYLFLLSYQFENGSIPAEPWEVWTLLERPRPNYQAWMSCSILSLDECFPLSEDGKCRLNPRMAIVRDESFELSEKRSKAAIAQQVRYRHQTSDTSERSDKIIKHQTRTLRGAKKTDVDDLTIGDKVIQILRREEPDGPFERNLDLALASAVQAINDRRIRNWAGCLVGRIRAGTFVKGAAKWEDRAKRIKTALRKEGLIP